MSDEIVNNETPVPETPVVTSEGLNPGASPAQSQSADLIASGAAQTLESSVQTAASALASPDDLATRIAALEPAAQAVLTDTLNHVLDGFINYSLPVGFDRLNALLK